MATRSPSTDSASPAVESAKGRSVAAAAMSSNARFSSRQDSKSGAETCCRSHPLIVFLLDTIMRLSGSFTEGFLRRISLITLKIVVFAPMPRARVRTATAVNPGFFASIRRP